MIDVAHALIITCNFRFAFLFIKTLQASMGLFFGDVLPEYSHTFGLAIMLGLRSTIKYD